MIGASSPSLKWHGASLGIFIERYIVVGDKANLSLAFPLCREVVLLGSSALGEIFMILCTLMLLKQIKVTKLPCSNCNALLACPLSMSTQPIIGTYAECQILPPPSSPSNYASTHPAAAPRLSLGRQDYWLVCQGCRLLLVMFKA